MYRSDYKTKKRCELSCSAFVNFISLYCKKLPGLTFNTLSIRFKLSKSDDLLILLGQIELPAQLEVVLTQVPGRVIVAL